MTELLFHPKVADRIQSILSRPPQGLLITGVTGSGKSTMSRFVAARILGIETDTLDNHAYVQIIVPVENSIKIEEIRNLQQFLKLKVPADKPGINRIVMIEKAERMRSEAQNALLKTLEEPPTDTMIILTAESPERLLSTIVSRCQNLEILPVSQSQAKEYFEGRGVKASELAPAYALSMGQAGLLSALLSDKAHPLKDQVSTAKNILGAPLGKRLLEVEHLAKDKAGIKLFLNSLSRISHAGLTAAAKQRKINAIRQWTDRSNAVLKAQKDLEYNANTKLLLTNLFLNL